MAPDWAGGVRAAMSPTPQPTQRRLPEGLATDSLPQPSSTLTRAGCFPSQSQWGTNTVADETSLNSLLQPFSLAG